MILTRFRLSQCQMLGEFLEENCPDVSVQVVIKSNEDWTDYIDSVSMAIFGRSGAISYLDVCSRKN